MTRRSTVVIAIIAVAILAGATCWRSATAPQVEIPDRYFWRGADRDGMNCLYLQLRLLGYRGSYGSYLDAIRQHLPLRDFTGLSAAARACGVSVAPARLTLQELQTARLPVICYIEQSDDRHGQFVLWAGLADSSAREAALVLGGPTLLVREDMDVFRREWSGVALVPATEQAESYGASQSFIESIFLLSLLWLGKRLFQMARHSHGGTGISWKRVLIHCLLLGSGAVNDCQPVNAQTVVIPGEIQAALLDNAKRLDPLSVSFTWQRRAATGTQEELWQRLNVPPDPAAFFFQRHGHVVWSGGKFYSHIDSLHPRADGSTEREFYERSFDGQTWYIGNRFDGDSKASLKKGLIASDSPRDRLDRVKPTFDCFDVMGYYLPFGKAELLESRFMSAVLSPRGNATVANVRDELLDGHKLVRIEVLRDNPGKELMVNNPELMTPEIRTRIDAVPERRTYVYYLDPERRFALRRQEEWYGNTTLLMRRDCTEFEVLPGRDVWLPRHCETLVYEFFLRQFPKPLFSDLVEIAAFDLAQPPDELFVLGKDYQRPSTRVEDATVPEAGAKPDGAIHYIVPARAADLEKVIKQAREGSATLSGNSGPRLVIIVNLVVVVAVCGYFGFRFWSRRRN